MERAIAPLAASERAMPGNYNASLRLAQALAAVKRYDDAIAACDRGLSHAPGPIGRTWLFQTKARVLIARGDTAAARSALAEAMTSAQAIVTPRNRDGNIQRVNRLLARVRGPKP